MGIPIDPVPLQEANDLSSEFDALVTELAESHEYRCGELPAPPQAPGVYLLAEGEDVLHVGRTRNLQARRRNHTMPGGGRNTATFAFLLARLAAQAHPDPLPRGREALEADPDFTNYFKQAKQRVRAMAFQCVVVGEPARQASFEIYASVALRSPHNDWQTH